MHSLTPLIAILSPLLASGLIGLLGRTLGERAARIGILALALSAGSAVLTLYDVAWHGAMVMKVPVLPAPFAPLLVVDRLAAVMLLLITAVSMVIHVYSRRYMQGEPGYVKFFGLLSLLTFVLLGLVTSGNLFWLLVYWHAVTWLLTALLSFHEGRAAARQAGRTAFWVLGLGDAALLIGMILTYAAFGTIEIPTLLQIAQDASPAPVLGSGTWWEMNKDCH